MSDTPCSFCYCPACYAAGGCMRKRDEHKDAAVQGATGTDLPMAPQPELPAQSAPSNAAGQVAGGAQEAKQTLKACAVPALAAPLSPRAAVLEAARICEAQSLLHEKYLPTNHYYEDGDLAQAATCGRRDEADALARLLRAYAATLPDESGRDAALEEAAQLVLGHAVDLNARGWPKELVPLTGIHKGSPDAVRDTYAAGIRALKASK